MAGVMVRAKHVPQRTCIVCRQVKNKRDLVRIVYTDRLEIDPSGKKPGRGAYLCPQRDCWLGALTKTRLEHALRRKITPADIQVVEEYIRTMIG